MTKIAIVTAVCGIVLSAALHVIGPPTTCQDNECCVACCMTSQDADPETLFAVQLVDSTRKKTLEPLLIPGPRDKCFENLDPPSDDEVLHAWDLANSRGGDIIRRVKRNNVRILKEKIVDYVDPPRDVPMIGIAQLHHVHFKCTIFCTEITQMLWPVPHLLAEEEVTEIIYIDQDHYHAVDSSGSSRESATAALP